MPRRAAAILLASLAAAPLHAQQITLTPTRNGFAYAGNAMGREIVYERSRAAVESDLKRENERNRR